MRPEHVQAFIDRVLDEATRASDATGIPVSVVLAQWGGESGWGRTPAARHGHNLGSIMGRRGPKKYPSVAAFVDDWIHVLCLPYYDSVRQAGEGDANPFVVARALGESPYDAGHYEQGGDGPGSFLVHIMQNFDLTSYDL